MILDEFIEIANLLEIYSPLLSEKQREYLEAYLEEDNSLTEIAEAFNVSRQAVFDNIKRGCKRLEKYEKMLGIFEKDIKYIENLKKLEKDFNIDNLKKLILEYEGGVISV